MELREVEKYLLMIIGKLRGNAYDSIGRLRRLGSIGVNLDTEQLDELLRELESEEFGAHLPAPNDDVLTEDEIARRLHDHCARNRGFLDQ